MTGSDTPATNPGSKFANKHTRRGNGAGWGGAAKGDGASKAERRAGFEAGNAAAKGPRTRGVAADVLPGPAGAAGLEVIAELHEGRDP